VAFGSKLLEGAGGVCERKYSNGVGIILLPVRESRRGRPSMVGEIQRVFFLAQNNIAFQVLLTAKDNESAIYLLSGHFRAFVMLRACRSTN
jgi:hypothetical protein